MDHMTKGPYDMDYITNGPYDMDHMDYIIWAILKVHFEKLQNFSNIKLSEYTLAHIDHIIWTYHMDHMIWSIS